MKARSFESFEEYRSKKEGQTKVVEGKNTNIELFPTSLDHERSIWQQPFIEAFEEKLAAAFKGLDESVDPAIHSELMGHLAIDLSEFYLDTDDDANTLATLVTEFEVQKDGTKPVQIPKESRDAFENFFRNYGFMVNGQYDEEYLGATSEQGKFFITELMFRVKVGSVSLGR